MKFKKSLGQLGSKCSPIWSNLHPNDQKLDKKAIIGQKWSKIIKLDVPNMLELDQNGPNWSKMAKNKISIRFT